MPRETATVTGANEFTNWLDVNRYGQGQQVGKFGVKISGTFVATVTVQAKEADAADSTALDVESFTSPVLRSGEITGNYKVRVGVKTGDFTSGSVGLVISH